MSWRPLTAVAVALVLAGSATAQPRLPQPPQIAAPQRPAFSPYLNLVRPGGSPTLNYYGLVRPEIQARQAIQNLQGAVANNQQDLGALQADAASGLPTTGHQTMFLNHGSYFMTGGATGAGGARSFGPNVASGFNRAPPRR